MKTYAPAYYRDFRCIAERCRHNCCIGWEIDIDETTLASYLGERGAFGARLRDGIDLAGDVPHFRLADGDRCPFLDQSGLCEIIRERGEDALCDICREHPRFYNDFSARREVGLGLVCEEAARLILGECAQFHLICVENDAEEEMQDPDDMAFIALRDRMISVLYEKKVPPPDRISRYLSLAGANDPSLTPAAIFRLLSGLEKMDHAWDEKLLYLSEVSHFCDISEKNERAFERLMTYFTYRHLAPAYRDGRVAAGALFAWIGTQLILTLPGDIAENARMFSAEIEYSEENTEALMSQFKK